MNWDDIRGIAPLIWPLAAALGVLCLADRRSTGSRPLPPFLAVVGLLGSLFAIWRLWPESESHSLFRGAIVLDGYGLFLAVIVAICGIATVLLSIDYLKRREKNMSEFYVLVLFAAMGMMLMGMSRSFITILFGIEVMSISLYVLAGLFRERAPSAEAAMKYFLTGSFATGLLVFGMGMVYGATGSLDLSAIGALGPDQDTWPLLVLGLGFMLAGLAFKVAAVPFHMWLPDVYEGAPTTVTGFMAAGVKIAAFGAIIRVFCEVYQHDAESLRNTLWWMAFGTMTLGNVAALAQKNVKRMLAYSSIAHAGYLLLAVVVMQGV
ncbi:MAG: NADH-quinone oxidoreductase subunit N, partial [Planctomycetes bacterium]|nr:NADH-quinone oxidoreductase subunit N [Planctomycetota bacterium]